MPGGRSPPPGPLLGRGPRRGHPGRYRENQHRHGAQQIAFTVNGVTYRTLTNGSGTGNRTVSARPILDQHGRLDAVVISARVADAQVKAEQELIDAREHAERLARAKSTFLANMSNEIRTPLTAVMGLQTLLEGTDLNAQQADFVKQAGQSASFLLGILNDVLDYSKIDAGSMALHLEPVSLARVVEEVAEVTKTAVAARPVRLSTAIDPDLPAWVMDDGLRLRQVLANRHDPGGAGAGIRGLCPGRDLHGPSLRGHGPGPDHQSCPGAPHRIGPGTGQRPR